MLTASRDARVFVNCPFDAKYLPLLQAVIFAIHDLGFQARHALIDDSEPIRLRRIANELEDCRYSIHDLSRVEIGGSQKLPRFNMPFEAGLAYAAHASGTTRRPHHFLLLEAAAYRYQATLSDAAGLDPKIHHGRADLAIDAVRFPERQESASRFAGRSLRIATPCVVQCEVPKIREEPTSPDERASLVKLHQRPSGDHDSLDRRQPVLK